MGRSLLGSGRREITRIPETSDLSTDGNKFVIIKGCDYAPRSKPKKITQKINLLFDSITNPYSVRETSVFKIEVYKEYTQSEGLKLKIQETTQSTIPASLFKFG